MTMGSRAMLGKSRYSAFQQQKISTLLLYFNLNRVIPATVRCLSMLIRSTCCLTSLDYPDSVRCQHVLAPHTRNGVNCSANIATRAAIPQNKIETLIGSQANYKMKTKIRIYSNVMIMFLGLLLISKRLTSQETSFCERQPKYTEKKEKRILRDKTFTN